MVRKGSCADKTPDLLAGYLPILAWIPHYRLIDFLYDAISGVTVALTLMPQAIAYASLAGLDPLVSNLEKSASARALPPRPFLARTISNKAFV